MKGVLYSVLLALTLTVALAAHAGPSPTPASIPVPAASTAPPETKASAAAPDVVHAASSASAKPGKALDLDTTPPLPLKKGMKYGIARDKLIAQGWRPVRDPYCTWGVLNIFGDDQRRNYKEMCKSGDPFYKDACHVCSRFPELSACTGDGYCDITFAYGSDWLSIMIHIDYLNNDGMKSAPVTDWGQVTTRPWPYKQ